MLKFQISNFKFLTCGCRVQILTFLLVCTSFAADLSDSYFKEGLKMVKEEQYGSAIKLFNQAIKQNKNRADIYLNLGACYERLNQFDIGEPIYLKALKLDPSNAQFNFLFGKALIRNNKINKGVSYLEKAVNFDPDNPNFLYALGVGYVAINRYDLAEPTFIQAKQYAPKNCFIWHNLGLSQLYLGKTNEAYQAFKKIEIDSPIAAARYYQLANIDFQNKKLTDSLKNVKMAMALDPDSRESKKLFAEILVCNGNYSEGIKIFEHLQKKDLNNFLNFEIADAYQKWAEKEMENKKFKMALDKYKQILRFIPETQQVKIGIAECEKEIRNR